MFRYKLEKRKQIKRVLITKVAIRRPISRIDIHNKQRMKYTRLIETWFDQLAVQWNKKKPNLIRLCLRGNSIYISKKIHTNRYNLDASCSRTTNPHIISRQPRNIPHNDICFGFSCCVSSILIGYINSSNQMLANDRILWWFVVGENISSQSRYRKSLSL